MIDLITLVAPLFSMPVLGVIGTGAAILAAGALSAGAGMMSANSAAKAAAAAADKAKIDINALDAQTRAMALRNAQDSAALEKALTPEVPELRTAANKAVLSGLTPDSRMEGAANSLYGRLGQGATSPLLQAAIEKARADLALGGRLSQDQQNEATRRGAAAAGTSTGGLGLGRDLAARDLGLTSYQVEQQRLANAAGIGGQELGMNQFNANNFLNQFSALQTYGSNRRSQDLAAAQYGESIQQPVVGMDPSAAANVAVGNSNAASAAAANAANIKGASAQGMTQLGGQLLGYGLAAYGGGGFGGGMGSTNGVSSGMLQNQGGLGIV